MMKHSAGCYTQLYARISPYNIPFMEANYDIKLWRETSRKHVLHKTISESLLLLQLYLLLSVTSCQQALIGMYMHLYIHSWQ